MAYTAFAPDRVISASDFYVTVNGNADGLAPGYEAYPIYLTNWVLISHDDQALVPHVAVEYSYQNGMQPAYDGQDGKQYCLYPPVFLHVILSEEGQAAGAYTFRFTLVTVGNTQPIDQGVSQTLEMPLQIAQAPLQVAYDNAHPIPGLKAWEDHMIELADKWKSKLIEPSNNLGDANWYYDVTSVYQEIDRYIHDSERYWDVAYKTAGDYRDYLARAQPPGSAAPWAIFPRGMRQMYQSTHAGEWSGALESLTESGWVKTAGSPSPLLMRETAYAAAVWLELEWIEQGDREMLERSVTYLLGQFNLLSVQSYGKNEGMSCQPFFFGLAMQSLIDYYDFVPDERIPQSLMATCAWLWENAVDARTGYVLYDVWSSGGLGHDNERAYTGLNPLLYNAWGFLYAVTGDNQWRRQGDILFEHQFDDGGYAWSPKQFAQMYRRSCDYVTRWRA